jgi:hypothetical protein
MLATASFYNDVCCSKTLYHHEPSAPPFWGEWWHAAMSINLGLLQASVTDGIWLILPVVICLSQRLSHACLSISNLYGETANGSLNQLSFI